MDSYIWVDGSSVERTIYISGVEGDLYVESEDGWDDSNVELQIEESPNRFYSHYRGFAYNVRDYVLVVTIEKTTPALLKGAMEDWKSWHNRELGEGYIKRSYDNDLGGATVRCLDCIPGQGKWTRLSPSVARVEQHYIAAWPFWRDGTTTTASDDMDDDTPVNLSCANDGDIPAPILATWTGIANTPKLTNSDSDYLELMKVTANADDVLVADTRPRGSTRHYNYFQEHGAGALAPVSASSGSEPITLPLGTHNLAVVGATGETSTAALVVTWYNYYVSLY